MNRFLIALGSLLGAILASFWGGLGAMLAPKTVPNGVREIGDFHFGAILAPSWGGLGTTLG